MSELPTAAAYQIIDEMPESTDEIDEQPASTDEIDEQFSF